MSITYFLFLCLLSITLMVSDQRSTYLNQPKWLLAYIVSPLQHLVDWPVRMIGQMQSKFVSKRHLLQENTELRARQLLLNAKLQRFRSIEQENHELRALLQSTIQFPEQMGEKFLVSQVLAVHMHQLSHKLTLDRGSQDNVYVGQPVLDPTGVMGQIIDTGPSTAQLLLLTDNRSALPVQNVRSGTRAIAVGTGLRDELSVIHVPKTADVRVGDLFVTSGLARRFPAGYPVGKVSDVHRKSGSHFIDVKLIPTAFLFRSRLVLLVWPKKET